MALTSEKQKEYNLKTPKGGYSYYTLYRGVYDPTNGIDERPSYAETGDRFEPVDSDKVYVCTRRKGKATWAEDENAQRQTETGEGGGGSFPANFPEEGVANAGKYVGFNDTTGAYEAKNAPSGGASSWNDLTDKPFYEETTPAIDLSLDIEEATGGVEASLVLSVTNLQPITTPVTMYRVGDVLTAAQMSGATAEVVTQQGENDPTTADATVAGETAQIVSGDGFAVFGSPTADSMVFPYVFSVAEGSEESRSFELYSNTADETETTCELRGVFAAGTYLMYVEVTNNKTYCDAFSKDAVTTVHQLAAKFVPAELPAHSASDAGKVPTVANDGSVAWGTPVYPAYFDMTLAMDGSSVTVTSGTGVTYAAIAAAIAAGRPTYAHATVDGDGVVIDIPFSTVSNDSCIAQQVFLIANVPSLAIVIAPVTGDFSSFIIPLAQAGT